MELPHNDNDFVNTAKDSELKICAVEGETDTGSDPWIPPEARMMA